MLNNQLQARPQAISKYTPNHHSFSGFVTAVLTSYSKVENFL